jgi:hypothetical protein
MKKAATLVFGAIASLAAMTAVNAASTDDLSTVKTGRSYSYAFASTKPPASFLDTVDFDLTTAADVSNIIFGFGTKGLTVELLDLSNPSVTFSPSTALTQNYVLAPGDYALDITGKTRGPKGSSSLIIGQLSIAAVPEPGTLAMILAGAGLLAMFQWRRRGKSHGQSLSTAA